MALAVLALGAATVRAADLQITVDDSAGQPLIDTVIYAELVGGAVAARPNSGAPVVIDQIHKAFVPRVTVVQTGTAVDFPNSDNIRHEVYSFSPAKVFTSKLYSGKQSAPVVFDKPGAVALGCNIHDHMLAWVRVVNTPYFTKSGTDGIGTITGLKPGDYRLSVWYPAADSEPKVQDIHVNAEGAHLAVQLQPPVTKVATATPAAP
jgi:plastocyanin